MDLKNTNAAQTTKTKLIIKKLLKKKLIIYMKQYL